jgi:NMD protein affecting ribosome stability and mRNA decay
MDPIRIKKDEKYSVKICSNCFKHEHKGKMIPTASTDDAVYDMLEQRFKLAKKVELFIPVHKQNPGINVEAEAVIDKKFIVPILISYTICPNCSKLLGQAFNGILQLRNPSKEILAFVQAELKRGTGKNVHCIKEDDVTNGRDYHLTDAGFTLTLGRKLQNTFGGELVISVRLVSKSRQTSKDLYRTTALFRYPKFKKGDVVSYKGRDVQIINFAKKVYVLDLKSNRKEQIPYDKIQ